MAYGGEIPNPGLGGGGGGKIKKKRVRPPGFGEPGPGSQPRPPGFKPGGFGMFDSGVEQGMPGAAGRRGASPLPETGFQPPPGFGGGGGYISPPNPGVGPGYQGPPKGGPGQGFLNKLEQAGMKLGGGGKLNVLGHSGAGNYTNEQLRLMQKGYNKFGLENSAYDPTKLRWAGTQSMGINARMPDFVPVGNQGGPGPQPGGSFYEQGGFNPPGIERTANGGAFLRNNPDAYAYPEFSGMNKFGPNGVFANLDTSAYGDVGSPGAYNPNIEDIMFGGGGGSSMPGFLPPYGEPTEIAPWQGPGRRRRRRFGGQGPR